MISRLFYFFILIDSFVSAGQSQTFGSTGVQIPIKEINGEYPSMSQLFGELISKSKPVVSRQVLNSQNYFDIWQSDEKLEKEVYGLMKSTIRVDGIIAKRRQRISMQFGEFLERYQKEPLIFVDTVPTLLLKYLVVPRPLQCDIVLETFQSTLMLMNGINASPLLLSEAHDHFHCVYRGQKKFVLVDSQTYPKVREIVVPDNKQARTAPLNPDSVDLDEFPALANVEYHVTTLKSGDCLFVPSDWIFQERSLESSIGIIYNINHHQANTIEKIDIQNCQNNQTYDENFTLDQIDWTVSREPPNLKELMIKLIQTKVQGFEKWQKIFSKHLAYDLSADPELSAVFEEFYGIVDMDGDGEVTMNEIEQIDGAHQHHISDILYEIAKGIHQKQKETGEKSKKNSNEYENEHVEDNEENSNNDEYLSETTHTDL